MKEKGIAGLGLGVTGQAPVGLSKKRHFGRHQMMNSYQELEDLSQLFLLVAKAALIMVAENVRI